MHGQCAGLRRSIGTEKRFQPRKNHASVGNVEHSTRATNAYRSPRRRVDARRRAARHRRRARCPTACAKPPANIIRLSAVFVRPASSRGKPSFSTVKASTLAARAEPVEPPPQRVPTARRQAISASASAFERESRREQMTSPGCPRRASARREQAEEQVAGEHDDAHAEQVATRRPRAKSLDLHHPRHRPQSLDREERAHAEAGERRDPPEARMREHRAHAAELRANLGAVRRPRRVGNAPRDPQRHRKRRRRERDEDRAPVREAQRDLERRRRGQRTQRRRQPSSSPTATPAARADTTSRCP